MKTMLRLFSLVLVLTIGTTAFAQDKKGMHKMKNDSAFSKLSERLNLTADQQTLFKEVTGQNRSEMKTLREANKNASKEDKRKSLAEQLKKHDERILNILNNDQKIEYAKIKEEKKAEFKSKRGKHKKQ